MRTQHRLRDRRPPLSLPLRPARALRHDAAIRIALVNNMPDAALLETEQAYRDLAATAAEQAGVRVHLSIFAIEGVARSDRVRRIVRQRYGTFDDLRRSTVDAVIITGTEPRKAELTEETFWSALTDVLSWAEEHTVSCLLSCLAAHAAALHFEGVGRTPLARKCSGVFDIEKVGEHVLTEDVSLDWRAVHSRRNDLPEAILRACGYTILGRAGNAGVHLFVKQTSNLRVCFQGHPEYGGDTLLREYKRDVMRFLRREQAVYPETPCDYFDGESEQRLAEFREAAEQMCELGPMPDFPDGLSIQSPADMWREAAVRVFANWLTLVGARVSHPGACPRASATPAQPS